MFLDETLFDNVSFNVDSSDKIGFVGVNGAGKSTLFKIMTGDMDYDEGEIFKNKMLKIGYLDQYSVNGSEKSIWEETLTVFSEVIELEEQLDEIRFDIENGGGDIDSLIKKQTAMQDKFAEMDGFYYKSKVKSTLTGLGFSEDEFNLCVDKLSGGQKTRVALGKILLSDANLLLLDEPTNHLDIESVEWLEDFLKSYNGAFIVISHDRYFLDKVTNKTFELEMGQFRSYNGNYSAYMAQREIDKKTEQRNYDNTMREIQRLENVVEQQRRWGREKNIKTAESKIKVIEKLESTLIAPMQEADDIAFSFRACAGGGQDVLQTENLGMTFGETPLFSNADMFIKKGEKVFLLGPNGCGKTTLLKIIMGEYEPSEGSYKIGANIHVGYYDQIQENLHMDKTVIDEVWDEYPNLTQTQIRNALAVFLFRGEDVFKEIHKLSGGERARVELVKLMLKSVNLLIMDEPTNHLDIESREALENALKSYDGTMLMVSHDRYFINKLADRILYLTPNGIENHIGGYDSFVSRAAVKEEKKQSGGALDYKEQKRLEAEKRKTINRFNKVEKEISEKEEKKAKLNKELENPEIATDYVKAGEITEQITAIESEIELLMEEWESLQITIEESGYEV
ncbi:MAG: ABC-F family ATP-binding cassette domain-containing protein [Oscillospiraceae bacterium]|nr:ABC-F family ATP-binding cassette domain-containing protein [Oscillospiraceae bacterium]